MLDTNTKFDVYTLLDWTNKIDAICDDDVLSSLNSKKMIFYEIIDFLGLNIKDIVLQGRWYTASEIANILGVSKQKIGKIANEYGLKNNQNYSFATPVKINEKKYSFSWFYNERALTFFRKKLKEQKDEER
jgi:hypothetical protein